MHAVATEVWAWFMRLLTSGPKIDYILLQNRACSRTEHAPEHNTAHQHLSDPLWPTAWITVSRYVKPWVMVSAQLHPSPSSRQGSYY